MSNSEKQIRRNLRILEFQDLGLLDSATHRHGELPDGPGLGPALPHSAIPDGRARSSRLAESALLAHCASAFPAPPPTPFLAFTLCQMGVNSSSSFKTLLGGGDSQAPSGTPTVPVTLLYPDPAHTPAGDSRSGLSPP